MRQGQTGKLCLGVCVVLKAGSGCPCQRDPDTNQHLLIVFYMAYWTQGERPIVSFVCISQVG